MPPSEQLMWCGCNVSLQNAGFVPKSQSADIQLTVRTQNWRSTVARVHVSSAADFVAVSELDVHASSWRSWTTGISATGPEGDRRVPWGMAGSVALWPMSWALSCRETIALVEVNSFSGCSWMSNSAPTGWCGGLWTKKRFNTDQTLSWFVAAMLCVCVIQFVLHVWGFRLSQSKLLSLQVCGLLDWRTREMFSAQAAHYRTKFGVGLHFRRFGGAVSTTSTSAARSATRALLLMHNLHAVWCFRQDQEWFPLVKKKSRTRTHILFFDLPVPFLENVEQICDLGKRFELHDEPRVSCHLQFERFVSDSLERRTHPTTFRCFVCCFARLQSRLGNNYRYSLWSLFHRWRLLPF